MNLIRGVLYNFRGLWLGIKTPRLLFWGLIRFITVVLITFLMAGLILAYHQDILNLIWNRPESRWVVWLWYLLSWILSLFLIGLAAILSYLLSQVLFSVIIMDLMSRITEENLTGRVVEPRKLPLLRWFFTLIGQELPRTFIPILVSVAVMILGWFVLLGPVMIILSTGIAVVFLAWDTSDLVPARRLLPFRERFRFLLKTLPFHLGFGLPFLLPGLNILLLSFAPVGGTLYYLEKEGGRPREVSEATS